MKELRRFHSRNEMFYLEDEQVDALKSVADSGDALSCYKYGRYLYEVRPESDSLDIAKGYLQRAQQGGVSDAYATLALYKFLGFDGLVERSEGYRLVEKGIELGSEHALSILLDNMIYGKHGYKSDINRAAEIIEQMLPHCDNPMLYYHKANITCMTEGLTAAKKWYEKAVEGGYTMAYFGYALSSSHNDNYELVDVDRYLEILEQGDLSNDSYSIYVFLELQILNYDIDEDESGELRDFIIKHLETIAHLGSAAAANMLGRIYTEELLGVEIDYTTAKSYFSLGMIYESGECCENLYYMLSLNNMADDDSLSMYALYGARYGSKRMLLETVDYYGKGFLTPYAAEIEQYYIPQYEDVDTELAEQAWED